MNISINITIRCYMYGKLFPFNSYKLYLYLISLECKVFKNTFNLIKDDKNAQTFSNIPIFKKQNVMFL